MKKTIITLNKQVPLYKAMEESGFSYTGTTEASGKIYRKFFKDGCVYFLSCIAYANNETIITLLN